MKNHTQTLPLDLIELILLKLPVKSVTRFKCVCKSWLSLISDPQFGFSHFDLALAVPSHRLLLRSNEFSVHSIDMDFGAVHFTLPPPSPPLADYASLFTPAFHQHWIDFHRKHWMLGSCRGLVLLNYRNSSELVLWNPSIGVYKRLPFSDEYDLINGYLYGFGYDISTDDYLLILICLGAYALFFSFKTNSWSRVDLHARYVDPDSEFQAGTLFSGAFHWLVFSNCIVEHDDLPFSFEEYVPFIIAFDLTQRSFTEIPLFDHFTEEKLEIYSLRVMGGCLCVCCSVQGSEMTEIWVMNEYKVHSSWTKTIVIPISNRFSPIFITKEGGIFGSNSTGMLEKRNGKGELLEHFIDNECQGFNCANLQSALYTESLLPLPVSLVGPSADDQQ
ncbi:hypothetical protein JHK84_051639 [Glycine max]|uniref:F-box/kelch-repeat protein n=1 Tax=Glycine soja TaxID=3848 RepID=A0A0B2SP20_GLYSO|nr:F-box/kelch-repeat protein At3g06240-like [Glycine soja]XP_028211893.1 F-box/kelch-repeat protein At3g06240-like [Glycine soja]KAG5096051.1 hypothetical protein JHK84_051639 [Glycine max]KAG4925951.1 hypothetical protein JHK87_051491 [Glycine soja]KHN46670.1 F-box/kelch-repeat protein [Glycine soja]RZB53961.1 F-box/kelch-repeat protein isoform A [Glycine soja]RZB53962.1 F-box/kelch-repeat protein isoform B [Glycine soja]